MKNKADKNRAAETELKKLSRKELLELLIEQSEEIERLDKLLSESESRLEDRTLSQTDAGTMAEAALSIHKVFEATDEAAAQYLENLRRCSCEQQEIYDRELEKAKQEAQKIIDDAEAQKNKKMREADEYYQETVSKAMKNFWLQLIQKEKQK